MSYTAAMQLPEVTKVLSQLATDPVVLRGEDLVFGTGGA